VGENATGRATEIDPQGVEGRQPAMNIAARFRTALLHRSGIAVSLLLLLFFDLCGAQTPAADSLVTRLAEQGFENLVVAVNDSEWVVQYENRVYRHEMAAAGIVLAAAVRLAPDIETLVLVPQNRGVAIARLAVPCQAYLDFVQGSGGSRVFSDQIVFIEGGDQPANGKQESSFWRFDLIANVGQEVRLGNYDDRFKLYGYVLPALLVTPWKGSRVVLEAIRPFYDDIGVHGEETRIGRANIGQALILPGNIAAAVQFGVHMPERWGWVVDAARFFWQRRILLGAQYSKTGFLYRYEDTWLYSPVATETWRVYATWFCDRIDLQLTADYARYLMGDSGPRISLMRNFGETSLGFYFTSTAEDKHGGVQVAIPLPPARRAKPAAFRINWPERYKLDYRATTRVYTIGPPIQTGISVNTGFDINDFYKRLNASTLANQVEIWQELWQTP